MNKDEFVSQYLRPNITVLFNLKQFVDDSNITVRVGEITLKDAGNYFCPWYYDATTQKEISAGFSEILRNPHARAVTIRDVETKIPSKASQVKQYIKDFSKKTQKSLCSFPIATDATLQKSLVLDGNKTLVALYQSWDKDKKIPVLEIWGADLVSILPDFCIVYES